MVRVLVDGSLVVVTAQGDEGYGRTSSINYNVIVTISTQNLMYKLCGPRAVHSKL